MANFAITNSSAAISTLTGQALSATYKTILSMGNSSATTSTAAGTAGMYRRGKIYDILVGTNAAPGDTYIEYNVARVTMSTSLSVTTITSLSSNFGLDPADSVGCVNQLCADSTSEYTASVAQGQDVWYVGVNQRASYRWVAAPGSELVWPAVSSATNYGALAARARGNYTGTVTETILFQEQ